MRTVRSSARFDASDSAARYEYYLIVRLSDGEVGRYGRDWCTVIAVLPIGAYMLKYNIHYFHFRLYMHLCQISQALLKFTDIFTALHFALNVMCFLSLSYPSCTVTQRQLSKHRKNIKPMTSISITLSYLIYKFQK